MAGKAWHACGSRKLAGHILSFTHKKQREREQEVEQGYQSSNLTSDDILLSARVHLLKTPHPPQRVQPTGDLDFNYLSLLGTFLLQHIPVGRPRKQLQV